MTSVKHKLTKLKCSSREKSDVGSILKQVKKAAKQGMGIEYCPFSGKTKMISIEKLENGQKLHA